MLKLSILIPFYNAEKYLARCLESALSQNLSAIEFEVLLRDDGSTDDGYKIAEDFQSRYPNLKVVRDINRGAYAQRNKLLQMASGAYLYFMDADDYIAHNALGGIVDAALRQEAQIAAFNSKLITWQNLEEDNYKVDFPSKEQLDIKATTGQDIIIGKKDMRYEIWWYLIQKDYLNTLALKFEEKWLSGDVLFTIAVLLNAQRATYCDDPVYRYYQSPNSIQRSMGREHMERLARSAQFQLIHFAKLLQKLKKTKGAQAPIYITLKKKKDLSVFFLFLRLGKNGYPIQKILAIYSALRTNKVLPIAFIDSEFYSGIKYRLLNIALKSKALLSIFFKVLYTIKK